MILTAGLVSLLKVVIIIRVTAWALSLVYIMIWMTGHVSLL